MKMKKVALIILVILLGLVIGFCIHLERTSEMSIQETELIDDASETTASVEIQMYPIDSEEGIFKQPICLDYTLKAAKTDIAEKVERLKNNG